MAKTIYDYISLAADGLGVIAGIIGGSIGAAAPAVLAAVKAVLSSIQDATAGKVTPEEVRAAWDLLAKSLAQNDIAALRALAAKFGIKLDDDGERA